MKLREYEGKKVIVQLNNKKYIGARLQISYLPKATILKNIA